MTAFKTILIAAGLLLGLAWSDARAAESYDNCTGFITTVPAVITTQGTWCLAADVATAINNGPIIFVNTNNVTIDCNDFKIGGLGAGIGTLSTGIYAGDRVNITVRNCSIRGFYNGIDITGANSAGHVIEDNRFDGNTVIGIRLQGDGSVIRRNRISSTGGSSMLESAYGIVAYDSVQIIDNVIEGVFAKVGDGGSARGINAENNLTGRVIGNAISGLVGDGAGLRIGIIFFGDSRSPVRDNDIIMESGTGFLGIACASSKQAVVGNVVFGFTAGLSGCTDDGGNIVRI